jgi:hypothetical protein
MNELTVIGVCTYHPGVQRWLRTLRSHFDGPCHVYLVNAPASDGDTLARRYHCRVVNVTATPHYWVNPPPGRFCRVWECVADACAHEVGTPFVLRTDVWDVVFQSDPRIHLLPTSEKILVARESVLLTDDAQNQRWVGPWYPAIRGGWVVNGGMICGPTASVGAVARLIAVNPFRTEVDQSELIVLTNTLRDAFEYRPGFMECLYNTFSQHGCITQGRFVDRNSLEPWCVVHGNGTTKSLLDSIYPILPVDAER